MGFSLEVNNALVLQKLKLFATQYSLFQDLACICTELSNVYTCRLNEDWDHSRGLPSLTSCMLNYICYMSHNTLAQAVIVLTCLVQVTNSYYVGVKNIKKNHKAAQCCGQMVKMKAAYKSIQNVSLIIQTHNTPLPFFLTPQMMSFLALTKIYLAQRGLRWPGHFTCVEK